MTQLLRGVFLANNLASNDNWIVSCTSGISNKNRLSRKASPFVRKRELVHVSLILRYTGLDNDHHMAQHISSSQTLILSLIVCYL